MKTLELEKMGLMPMTEEEVNNLEGGGWLAFGALVIGQVGIVAGVMTANPALIWGGAELTAASLSQL